MLEFWHLLATGVSYHLPSSIDYGPRKWWWWWWSQPGGLPGQLARLSLSQRRAARADEDEDYVDETRGRVIQLGEGPPGWAEQALREIQ